jgi:hypothetical protein
MHKQEMQRQWRKRGVAQNAALCRWTVRGQAEAGEARSPTIGAAALKFRTATYGGHGWPVWSRTAYANHNWPLTPSDELKARYRPTA